MKKLFGNTNLTWKLLIIFSIALGIGVGVLNRIPLLKDTSFQDIAIYLEMWIILAIFIIVNCKNWKEAVCKCFVFFLISQPLIYATEVLIDVLVYGKNLETQLILYFKNYYIYNGWLMWTILTIPGAFIAYQIKKNNVLASVILSVATGYLAYVGTKGLISIIINKTPNHLINSIICLSMAFVLIYIILENKKERIIASLITTIGAIIAIGGFLLSGNTPILANVMISIDENTKIVECVVNDENIATAVIEEEGEYVNVYSSKDIGTTEMKIKDENGKTYIYVIESTSKEFNVNENIQE